MKQYFGSGLFRGGEIGKRNRELQTIIY